MTTTYDINEFMPESGRRIKEDGTVVNTADQVDSFYTNGIKVSGSNAQNAYPISPSDTVALPNGVTKGLYVGTGGDVKITLQNGTTATFSSLSGGMIHPIAATQVWSTGTTASNLLAIY